ncbi:uncharacterized protein LOC125757097 [Rhipicephalus sanguineus]|uniref:uncharacterized protein LOC125757097 n=1 Tax=Rhipicephalus sanguineus TaxID=34632 RepID=UPI0020C52153|nr:uncharacterized protein LOC125757097 [Rhipicephalus sanguineus]
MAGGDDVKACKANTELVPLKIVLFLWYGGRSTGSLVGGTAMYFLGAETAFRIMGGVAALASASYGCFCCFQRTATRAAERHPPANADKASSPVASASASASNEDDKASAQDEGRVEPEGS